MPNSSSTQGTGQLTGKNAVNPRKIESILKKSVRVGLESIIDEENSVNSVKDHRSPGRRRDGRRRLVSGGVATPPTETDAAIEAMDGGVAEPDGVQPVKPAPKKPQPHSTRWWRSMKGNVALEVATDAVRRRPLWMADVELVHQVNVRRRKEPSTSTFAGPSSTTLAQNFPPTREKPQPSFGNSVKLGKTR